MHSVDAFSWPELECFKMHPLGCSHWCCYLINASLAFLFEGVPEGIRLILDELRIVVLFNGAPDGIQFAFGKLGCPSRGCVRGRLLWS